MMKRFIPFLTKTWYERPSFLASVVLYPLSLIYRFIVSVRKAFYRLKWKKTTSFSVPVIVVGNITVGGVGKTPVVAALVDLLRRRGLKPGAVSRGYKGQAKEWPQAVTAHSDPREVGDEPVMLVQKTNVPLVVGPDRVATVKVLLDHYDCDVVISDDGLQHYAMDRDIEIIVIDGERRFGNGHLLPAGPLREPIKRLKTVDYVLTQGKAKPGEFSMQLLPGPCYRIRDHVPIDLSTLQATPVHAVAGIGNPDRFFDLLRSLGFNVISHPFPDHHRFLPADIVFKENYPVLMTEKDAVKCHSFVNDLYYTLAVNAQLDEAFEEELFHQIQPLLRRKFELK